jgi:hypothetical protein
MQPVNHPLAPEELMAYLDGELPADQAVRAAAHLEQCAECRSLADGLRDVSHALAAWEVEPSAARMPQVPQVSTTPAPRKWFGLPRWAFGFAGAGVVVLLVSTAIGPNRMRDGIATSREAPAQFGTASSRLPLPAPAPTAAMIARTAQLQLTTRDFDHIRARLDDILKRHHGYFGELNVTTPTDAGRTLTGKLQIPADQLDATLSEIKPLGHVDSESQSGEEVTQSYTDLEARLDNSRHAEQRIVDLLRDRTGKLSDVLEAERELSRVRGEIEQMEAERKALLTRVDYSTLTLTVNEEYKSQLHVADSTPTKFRNAAVDGFRSMAGSLVSVALFLLSDGPVLLLWAAILFFPVRFAWRLWKAR